MAKTQQTFEKRLERVKEITALLEGGDLPLEQGVKLFQEGVRLSRECGAELEQARIIVESAGQEPPAESGVAPGDEA
jgi:exodeoxyribonuclease VII small subunit